MGYSHGEKWTKDKIISEILKVKTALEISRMPTKSECEVYFNNTCLSNAVNRLDIGWYGLAKELCLPVKECESTIGKSWENNVENILKDKFNTVERMTQNFPYDILVNYRVKIDIKAGRLYSGKNGNYYSFNLESNRPRCDLYILCALDKIGEIANYYIIPSIFVSTICQISIGYTKSKYNKFIDRWDYIQKYNDFFKNIENT